MRLVCCVLFVLCVRTGPWLDNYISLTSSRLSNMRPETQANLLSSLAVWKAQLSPAWLAMFQLLCVKQAEEGSMTADQLEQVGVLCCVHVQAGCHTHGVCQLCWGH